MPLPRATETLLVQTDAQILQLEAQLHSLKRRRNTLILACNVPPEILSKIFIELRDSLESINDSTWTAVTRVCSAWRAASLSFSPLWDHIKLYFINGGPSVERMIPLSANRPLRVTVEFKGAPSIIKQLPSHILPRITELELYHCPRNLRYLDFSLDEISPLYNPAPCLKSLYVGGADYIGGDILHIPDGFLANTAPSLKTATLFSLTLEWKSLGFLDTVRYLRISSGIIYGHPTEMLRAINRMKNLRKLEVDGVMEVRGHALPNMISQFNSILLPDLDTLVFHSDDEWADAFLRVLDAPRLEACEISVHVPSASSIISSAMFLRRHCQYLADRGGTIAEVRLYHDSLDILRDNSERAFFDFTVEDPESTLNWTYALLANGPKLSEVGLLTCFTDAALEMTLPMWEALAQRFTGVHTLLLSGSTFNTDMPLLFAADIQSGPYFPGLITVEVDTHVQLAHAITWVRTRTERGFPLSTFIVMPHPRLQESLDMFTEDEEKESDQVSKEEGSEGGGGQWEEDMTQLRSLVGSIVVNDTEANRGPHYFFSFHDRIYPEKRVNCV